MKTLKLKKRHKIILGFILFFILLLFSAPRAARVYIDKHSNELIGRRLQIEKIRFNYFTGTLRVNDLKLFEADGKTEFFSFKKLKINFDYLPLLRNEIYVKYLIVDDPYAEVLQHGNTFNFSGLIRSDTAAALKDTVPSKPLRYNINDININRGFVKYTDESINHTVSLNRVDLKIPGFMWNSDSTRLGIDFRFVDGGRLFSNLSLNQADSTYSVSLKLDSLNLGIVEPYVQNSVRISALHGYLSNDITINGDMRSIMKLTVHGMNHIFGLQLLDTLQRTILSFDDLAADIDTLRPDRNQITLKSIEIKKPFILFELVDSTNNWLSIIKKNTEVRPDTLEKEPPSQAASTGGLFAFSSLSVADGSIKVSDRTLGYPFSYTIDNIRVSGSSDPKNRGTVHLSVSAGLNGTGEFKADAAFNPDDAASMDVSVAIKEFRMQDIDAYFRHFFGFPVTGGRMNFSTEDILRNKSLVSNNALYFRKFTLARKESGKAVYNIPLRLALGVMSDKDGIIDVKAPVEMKGENVKVGNLRKIIFHTIGTLFVKAAVSPVKMLAEMFNADPESLKEINLPLSEPSPDARNMKSVDLIAEILTRKPGLAVDFVYCIDPEKTSDTLARVLAAEDYLRANPSGFVLNSLPDSVLLKYILSRVPADTLQANTDLGELCRKYIGSDILKEKIDSMKIYQTDFLRNYMIRDKQIPADRCLVTLTTPDSIRYEKPEPSFRIFFNAAGQK